MCNKAIAQIHISKMSGGSVITKLSMGIKVNENSTLMREWSILNDETSPIQTSNLGINTAYAGSAYYFIANGNLSIKEPITAYEIHYVLYDIFGAYMNTLSTVYVGDLVDVNDIKKSNWYASEHQVSEYYACVSYVATVRNAKGIIWKCNYKKIKEELNKIEISYEESYLPKNEKDK